MKQNIESNISPEKVCLNLINEFVRAFDSLERLKILCSGLSLKSAVEFSIELPSKTERTTYPSNTEEEEKEEELLSFNFLKLVTEIDRRHRTKTDDWFEPPKGTQLRQLASIFGMSESIVGLLDCTANGAKILMMQPSRNLSPIELDSVNTLLRILVLETAVQQKRSTVNESNTDPLSGFIGREYFKKLVNAQVELAQIQNSPISFALCDVDALKIINEQSLAEGDVVIRYVARVLRDSLPETCLIGRVGGNIFGVIACMKVDQLSALIDTARAQVCERSVDAVDRPVTISAGITNGYHPHDELVAATERGLVIAKREGRNRVVVIPT